jgi:hypothetical protein
MCPWLRHLIKEVWVQQQPNLTFNMNHKLRLMQFNNELVIKLSQH